MDDENIGTTNNDSNDGQVREGQSIIQPQPQDNATPFSPPDDPVQDPTANVDVRADQNSIDPTHQATDSASDIDSQQVYDEGLAGAAEASEPNAGNTVIGYDPAADQRNQDQG